MDEWRKRIFFCLLEWVAVSLTLSKSTHSSPAHADGLMFDERIQNRGNKLESRHSVKYEFCEWTQSLNWAYVELFMASQGHFVWVGKHIPRRKGHSWVRNSKKMIFFATFTWVAVFMWYDECHPGALSRLSMFSWDINSPWALLQTLLHYSYPKIIRLHLSFETSKSFAILELSQLLIFATQKIDVSLNEMLHVDSGFN